jgi:hypothetical protein
MLRLRRVHCCTSDAWFVFFSILLPRLLLNTCIFFKKSKIFTLSFKLGRLTSTFLLGHHSFWDAYFHKIKGREILCRSYNDLNTNDHSVWASPYELHSRMHLGEFKIFVYEISLSLSIHLVIYLSSLYLSSICLHFSPHLAKTSCNTSTNKVSLLYSHFKRVVYGGRQFTSYSLKVL